MDLIWDPDCAIPPSLVELLVSGIIDEHPAFRDVCLSMFIRLIKNLKARAKKYGIDRIKSLRYEIKLDKLKKNDIQAYVDTGINHAQWGSM